jgi:hypothetical protein
MQTDITDMLGKIRRFHAGAAALASRLERHDPHDGLDATQRAALRRVGMVARDVTHAINATPFPR